MATSKQPDLVIRNFNGEMSPIDFMRQLAPLSRHLALRPEESVEAKQSTRGLLGGFGGLFSGKGKTLAPTSTPAASNSTLQKK